jgi:hypothetical protein
MKRLSRAGARRLFMKARRDQGKRLAHVGLDDGATHRIQQLWQVVGEILGNDFRTEVFLTSPHPMLGMRTLVDCAASSLLGLQDVLGNARSA